jgi:hypothetical protein
MNFKQRVWFFLETKNVCSLCRWNCLRILFLLVQCMSMVVRRFVVGEVFFFFPFSFKNYSLILFVVGLLISFLIFFLIFNFDFWSFYESFIYFNFILNLNLLYIIFLIGLLRYYVWIGPIFNPFVPFFHI